MPDPDPRPPSSLRRISIIYGSALVLVLVLGAALIIVFHSNRSTPAGSSGGSGSEGQGPPVGNFAFDVREVKAVPTGKTAQMNQRAAKASKGISRVLDSLYYTGFLNPDAWQHADYGEAWKLFAPEAVSGARKDVRTITLGPDAGSRFQSVTAGNTSALFVKVLLDPGGHPATASVAVHFVAKAVEQAGGTDTIESSGEFFLSPGPHGWAITGYQVKTTGGGGS